MNEAALWNRIKPAIKDKGHLLRIESMSSLGIPDVNWCYKGIEIWMELKILRAKNKVHFEKHQPQYHIKRNRHGGLVYVVAGNPTNLIFARLTDLPNNREYVKNKISVCIHDIDVVLKYTDNKIDYRIAFMEFFRHAASGRVS